jgi:hypothetical protein
VGGEACVDLVGGGLAVGQRGDGVAVDGQQGGEPGDAELDRAAEVGVGRGLCVGCFEGGDDGIRVQPGLLGDLPVGGRLGQAESVDVEGGCRAAASSAARSGAAWRRAATPRAAASESITNEPSAISRS